MIIARCALSSAWKDRYAHGATRATTVSADIRRQLANARRLWRNSGSRDPWISSLIAGSLRPSAEWKTLGTDNRRDDNEWLIFPLIGRIAIDRGLTRWERNNFAATSFAGAAESRVRACYISVDVTRRSRCVGLTQWGGCSQSRAGEIPPKRSAIKHYAMIT